MNNDLTIAPTKDNYYDTIGQKRTNKFGMDTPKKKRKPYLRTIQIFVLHKQRFTSMTLINPVIGSFSHDNLDQADGAGILNNSMQVLYETVVYASGNINKALASPNRNNIPGFAQIHYDKSPSPLTVLGGGTNSIFGPGGVVDGVGSVIRNVQDGNILGAILTASNTYNNAKKIKKKDAKEELKGIAKDGVLEVGKQAGSITNPVASFSVGSALLVGSAAVASARGTADNRDASNQTVLTNQNIDTVNFLGPDEAYNLVLNNADIKEEIAAGIYFKDIGSRKGLTVAESNIEFEGSSDNVKTVYLSKVITDIRKLVSEGYIKISRTNLDVEIETEKANL
jgi:hypothetical protein